MVRRLAVDNETLLGEVCRLLSEGRQVMLRAKGDSMLPVILNDDTLVIAPVTKPREGDIALARVGSAKYVVHRIIRITGSRFTLMGDGNLYTTEHCCREDLYGTVISVIRNGREHSVSTPQVRLKASIRLILLPLRRLTRRIMNLKKRLFER